MRCGLSDVIAQSRLRPHLAALVLSAETKHKDKWEFDAHSGLTVNEMGPELAIDFANHIVSGFRVHLTCIEIERKYYNEDIQESKHPTRVRPYIEIGSK